MKVYAVKLGNEKGKEIFLGQKCTRIWYNGKEANLIGDIDNVKKFDVFSSSTQNYLAYCIRKSEQNEITVDEKTKGFFIVVK